MTYLGIRQDRRISDNFTNLELCTTHPLYAYLKQYSFDFLCKYIVPRLVQILCNNIPKIV